MKRKRLLPISAAEQFVLQALWDEGPAQVRTVTETLNQRGHDWVRATVITLLQRLEKKRYVTSDKNSHAFIFRAAVSKEEIARQRLFELADELFDGRSAPLMLSFAEHHDFTDAEIERLRKFIDDAELRNKKT